MPSWRQCDFTPRIVAAIADGKPHRHRARQGAPVFVGRAAEGVSRKHDLDAHSLKLAGSNPTPHQNQPMFSIDD